MSREFYETTRLSQDKFPEQLQRRYLLTIDVQIIQLSKFNECIVQSRLCDLWKDMFNIAKSRFLLLYYIISDGIEPYVPF